MSGKIIKTTEDELRRIIGEAVAAQFFDVGIIADDKNAVNERRRDFEFLHDLRNSTESAKSKVGWVILLAATGGLITMIVNGFHLWMKTP
jgi:hypothetical protein